MVDSKKDLRKIGVDYNEMISLGVRIPMAMGVYYDLWYTV